MLYKLLFIISILILSLSAHADEKWLIAAENELLDDNGHIYIEVVKPNNETAWPATLSIALMSHNQQEDITLSLQPSNAQSVTRTYAGQSKADFDGHIRVMLTEHASNRLLLVANSVEAKMLASNADKTITVAGQTNKPKAFKRMVVEAPEEDPTITANEPVYFIVGSTDQRDFDARFQLSFKYRPFDPEARIAKYIPYASNFYFGYTQTSLWDLGSESSPFKDTSYRPSLYYHWTESGKGINPSSWKFGVEHESNGRDGENSRSLNIAFVQPFWTIDFSGGKRFTFMPRIYTYLEKTDNRDMHHYRGYVDWLFRYGREDAAILTGMYRQGTDGYAQGQFDLSYPVSDKLFGRTGTFLHMQLLSGYGETLLDYNRRSDTQLRLGISVAR